MADPDYEMTEEDIDAVLNYLRLTDPNKATPEMAIMVLERMYSRLHTLEHISPEAIEEVLKDLEES